MKRNGKRFVKERAGLTEGLEEVLPDLLKKVREWKGMGRTSRLALHQKEEKKEVHLVLCREEICKGEGGACGGIGRSPS